MLEKIVFVCAICTRQIAVDPWLKGRDRAIAPICRFCEREYSDRVPAAGAFMDRRKAAHISALTNALCGKAHIKEWEQRHGRA